MDKLLEMLADSSKTQMPAVSPRSPSASCATRALPLELQISININYRANTVTLTGEEAPVSGSC
ncbi:MAG: hypothetical protein R3F17_09825 [Planctomycetota bacterium]